MSEERDLQGDIMELYEKMKMEEIFHLPSSSIQVKYQKRVRRNSRGVFHKVLDSRIELNVFARDHNDALDVVAAFFANERLKSYPHFGTRHGALLYMIPVIALTVLLFVISVVGSLRGEHDAMVSAIIAAVVTPFLFYWIGRSLSRRREALKECLASTGRFSDPETIEETVLWLGTKNRTWRYWLKRCMFYELFYLGLAYVLYLIWTAK